MCGGRCRSASSNPAGFNSSGVISDCAAPRKDRHQPVPLSLGTESAQTWLTEWTSLGLIYRGTQTSGNKTFRFAWKSRRTRLRSRTNYFKTLADKEEAHKSLVQVLTATGSFNQLLIVIHYAYICSVGAISMSCFQNKNVKLSIHPSLHCFIRLDQIKFSSWRVKVQGYRRLRRSAYCRKARLSFLIRQWAHIGGEMSHEINHSNTFTLVCLLWMAFREHTGCQMIHFFFTGSLSAARRGLSRSSFGARAHRGAAPRAVC